MVYDSLLVFAVLMLAITVLMPFTGGKAIEHNALLTTYLFLIIFFFFAGFWIHGGQTLGMRAWRLRIQRNNGQPIGWWHALLRFMTGLPAWFVFGLGIIGLLPITPELPPPISWLSTLPVWLLLGLGGLWILNDNWNNSWRDRFTETKIVILSKQGH